MERAFLARGPQFTGDIYADKVHPNHKGHEMLADVLDALITDRDIRIWKHGPASDRARAMAVKP
jgi:phospholipase/lecithinase/hemolysin